MVVEDEGIVAAHIASQLSTAGYEVAGIAQSSEEVLALVAEKQPDLILMDIRIKGPLDGIATTGILRDRYDIPVIFLTAHTDRETVDRAKTAGALNFLTKPVQPGSLKIAIEMAIHKHAADREIRQQRAWLATVLDTMADAMIVIDREAKVQFMNAPAVSLTGWDIQIARNRPVGEILPLEETVSGRDAGDALLPGSNPQPPRSIPPGLSTRKRSGKKFPVDGEIALSLDREQVLGAVITFRDETARQAMETERRQEYKMQAVGRLAAGVAHDFNNLLFVILGYVENIQNSAHLDEREAKSLEEIRKAGETAAMITKQLLQFSRSTRVEKQDVDLNALIRDSENLCRRLGRPDIRWLFNYGHDLGFVYADPGQLKQVLLNLVTNARDAMPEGGTITIETANAHKRGAVSPSQGKDDFVALRVTDTGIGMKPETAERLFEPFFTTKELGQGTGLGLSIVHSIVTDSGGSIQVESAPGQGSTFTVCIPRAGADPGARLAEESESPEAATVLLVEDNPAVRSLLCKFLEPTGYRILEAVDGGDAIRIGNEYEGPIDLLISDIMMPRANGFEVAQALSERRRIAAIFISGHAEAVLKQMKGIPAGARFLPKPFLREDLLKNVGELLKQRKRTGKMQTA
jgi:PAS domain S-box-containing protein